MNKQSVVLPGAQGAWGSYVSKYQPDSSKVLDNMFTAGSKNFVTDQTGMVQKRQGGVQWNRTSFAEPARDSYEAVFDSGARHFLRVGGGVLSASTGTGLFDVITSGYSLLGNFEWVTYQNRSYGCNGINAPQVYDTAIVYGGVTYTFATGKTKAMGSQPPTSAPTAGVPSAGGAIPIGPHRYKITYVYYGAEESNGSAASVVQTTTSGNQTIALTAIPIGGYGVTARNIYRDSNNDGVYLLLDTISDNTTTSYTDVLLIGSTPTPMPLFNDVPPTFSKIALWLDSIFIAPTGEPNTIRFSNAGAPDVFDPDNYVVCQSDDVISALYAYNGKLYVFGLHSFGSIEGNTPDTFYYHNINDSIGCVDNRSIQVRSIVSVPTLWWLSSKGMYYSNGNTVEYGSDYIQDLVNLNLAQVNYSINRNTQTSQTDFAGDTRTPGIDITTNPGSVMTLNPKQEYTTNADWIGGSSLTNCKTTDGDSLEVVTRFAPNLYDGSLSGDAYISTNPSNTLFLTQVDNYTGDTKATYATMSGVTSSVGAVSSVLQSFVIPYSGTLTSFDMKAQPAGDSSWIRATIRNDGVGMGSVVWQSSVYAVTDFPLSYDANGAPFRTFTFVVSAALTGSTRYWIGIESVNSTGSAFAGHITSAFPAIGTYSGSIGSYGWHVGPDMWVQLENTSPSVSYPDLQVTYSFVMAPIVSTGGWLSTVYDAGGDNAVSAQLVQTGSYPAYCSGTTTVYAADNEDMVGAISEVINNPASVSTLTQSGKRYWQILTTLDTTDNRSVPSMSAPIVAFSLTAEWESQPIDSTVDNTSWGTLTYTANEPLGTSVALYIATSPDNVTYSAYSALGSAIVEQWAKVKVVLTSSTSNVTSPSLSSVTLTWNVTSTITSSVIDTGAIPAGFNIFQWEQLNPGVGTVTFFIRTAATSGGIPATSFVQVANGEFPNLTALEFVQWKAVLTSSADNVPEITSITVSWFVSAETVGVRCSSIFYNKTYYLSVATVGSTTNNIVIQLDQFNNWRIQKDTSVGTFLSYFNTLYFTDGITGLIYNGFIADTDNGVAIEMDVRTKAWTADNDLFLKLPRAFKVTGLNTGTTLHAYYSSDRGQTWTELLNESGVPGFVTDSSGIAFTTLFVPDATTLNSGRSLMYRLVSNDVHPCSIINCVPSFYSRKGRYLSNG
jgi:hypothetical protein